MRSALFVLAAAIAVFAAPAFAEDIAGSVFLNVTETPVAQVEGTLTRDEVIAVHELRADRGVVLLERAGPGAVSSQAGAVLIAMEAGARAHLYCDISSRRALAGGFIPCFEDQDGDGRLETRYLGSTRMAIPSSILLLAAPDRIEPASYREAEAHERPVVRLGFDPCAIGQRPTFKLVVSTEPGGWSTGGRCQSIEQMLQNLGIGITTEQADNGVRYRLTQPLQAGSEILFFPSP